MACSKYGPTKETTNAARVAWLLLDPCSDLLRDILSEYVAESQFYTFLKDHEKYFREKLLKYEVKQLYPKGRVFQGSFEYLDLSLLCNLLKLISLNTEGLFRRTILSTMYNDLDKMQRIRNTKFAHLRRYFLSDKDFNDLWKDLTDLIRQLERKLPWKSNVYQETARYMKGANIDPENEEMFLTFIKNQDMAVEALRKNQEKIREKLKELKELKENQEEMREKLNNVIEELRENDEEILKNLDSRKKELREKFKKIWAEITELKDIASKHEKIINTIKANHEDLKAKHEVLKSNLEASHEDHKERIDTLEHDSSTLSSRVDKIERSNTTEKLPGEEHTKGVLDGHSSSKLYARTRAVDDAKNKLREKHIAILTGKGGTGKTTAAYQILCEMSQEPLPYTPILIETLKQLQKIVISDHRCIIYIDDFLGSSNFNEEEFNYWKKLKHIRDCLNSKAGNIIVLLGLRVNILEEARLHCADILNKDYEVDLFSLITREEKKEILERYEEDYFESNREKSACKLASHDREQIIDSDPFYGFPLTCFSFFAKTDFFNLGAMYFKRPDEVLLKSIDTKRKSENDTEKVSYCILCYVLVNGHVDLQSEIEGSELLQDIYATLRMKFGPTYSDIKDAVANLKGVYLSTDGREEKYTFSHESVREAVYVSFGEVDLKFIIERGQKWTLIELLRTQGYESKPGEVVLRVRKNRYKDLARILLCYPKISYWCLILPIFQDAEFVSDFVDISINDLEKNKSNQTITDDRKLKLLMMSYYTSGRGKVIGDALGKYLERLYEILGYN